MICILHFDGSCSTTIEEEAEPVRLHLSPSGAQLVAVQLHSHTPLEVLRVSTSNVPLKFQKTVNQLLEFRNKFTSDSVYCHHFGSFEHVVHNVKESAFARWPTPSKFDTRSRDSMRIESENGGVSLSIVSHGQAVQVSFPVRSMSETALVLVRQTFSVIDLPECWIYPTELLKGELPESGLMSIAAKYGICSVHYVAIPLPKSNQNVSVSSPVNVNFHPARFLSAIKVLQSPQALYRVIVNKETRAVLVEATFPDGVVMRCNEEFTFLSLFENSMSATHYQAVLPPETARNWTTGAEYHIKEVTHEMTRLYYLALQSLAEISPSPELLLCAETFQRQTNKEIATVTVDGVGVFRAYSNDSVFVQFDNALTVRVGNCQALCAALHLSGFERMQCGVDGTLALVKDAHDAEYAVRVFFPLGLEKEMAHVLSFIEWTFTPPNEHKSQSDMKRVTNEIFVDAINKNREYLKLNEHV